MLDPDISTADALAHLSQPETDRFAFDRRRFLQMVGAGAGVGALGGLGPFAEALAAPVGADDGILVVIGMFGGNDGLNTVVPINDGHYQDQHNALALQGDEVVQLDSETGLNAHLTSLKSFWDNDQLAIVEGIGYPNPDLSHFNSMAYWMAGRPHALPASGWLGRWLDGYLGSQQELFAAAEVGYTLPLHLVGATQRGTAIPPSKPNFGASTNERDIEMYAAIRQLATGDGWRRAVSQAFVDQLDVASTLAPHIPDDDDLPDSDNSARLEVAARLINANLGFRVLTAGWGDFDSHAGQAYQHQTRMQELNAAIARFFEVLDDQWVGRVTVMTFSEFGRTSWSEGDGTDHGTAAPHFVFGANVKGGRYGQRPSLAGLGRWDRMAHHVDFRSYYASIIDGWLGGGSSDVLGGSYENLQLFRSAPTTTPVAPIPGGGGTTPAPGGGSTIPPVGDGAMFVPLAPHRIVDTRDGTGAPKAAIGPAQTLVANVAGAGVPTGAVAVAANVTTVGQTSDNYLTVYPAGSSLPETSSLNAVAYQTVPNLCVTGINGNRQLGVYNSHGNAHTVVDVFGYFTPSGGDGFTAVTPGRLFDTRDGTGVRTGKLANKSSITVKVRGKLGVPGTATAVVMNLTATAPEAAGHLVAYPEGSLPETSNLNFGQHETRPNLVICKIGDDGAIRVGAVGRNTHVIGDVFGYFAPEGARLMPIAPTRLLDTRSGNGAAKRQLAAGVPIDVKLAGRGGIPADAKAVAVNVTAAGMTTTSHLTVWPTGSDMPATSSLNIAPGGPIANLVICGLGAGSLTIDNFAGATHVIADVTGYFV